MSGELSRQVAIVTGGASGIGKEVATRFVAEGGSVVINGRDAAKAEAVAREIDATGKRVAVHAGDIALPATGEAVALDGKYVPHFKPGKDLRERVNDGADQPIRD